MLSQQCIDDLPDDFICNISIYAADTTLHPKCDQASNFWQQLELASEFECDLYDPLHWSRKWLVDFSAGKNARSQNSLVAAEAPSLKILLEGLIGGPCI